MYRRLWVPDQRAEPFSPLSARRQSWIISPGVAAELPPARVTASAPNDIIRTRLPRSTSRSRTNCCSNYLIVLSADRRQDNRRRLPRPALRNAEERGVPCATDHPTIPRSRALSKKGSARSPHRRSAVVRSWLLLRTDNRTLANRPAGCSPPHADTRACACGHTAPRLAGVEPPPPSEGGELPKETVRQPSQKRPSG